MGNGTDSKNIDPRGDADRSESLTVGHIMESASRFLEERGISDGRISCEWLFARLLRCSRLDLPQRSSSVLSEAYVDAMRRAIKRLAANEPVQYILGEWDFRGHTLKVDSRALIPRPETEQLVQLFLDWEAAQSLESPLIADVGTGSGCIAVSLAVELSSARVLAIDVSDEALALAGENAQLHDVQDRVSFASAGLSDILDRPVLDAIIANLPYIPTATVEGLSERVKSFEPYQALDGGDDGLHIVRDVAADATMALRDGGGIFLEIGEEQGTAVAELLTDLGFEGVKVHSDLTGRVRFVTAFLP